MLRFVPELKNRNAIELGAIKFGDRGEALKEFCCCVAPLLRFSIPGRFSFLVNVLTLISEGSLCGSFSVLCS
jgi:hypothetical protein